MLACSGACLPDLNATTNSTEWILNTSGFFGSCLRVKFNKIVTSSLGTGIHIPSLAKVETGPRLYAWDFILPHFELTT